MDLFYWYIICKLLKALTWKDLFLFILYCGSGYILKKFWIYPPIGNEVDKVLWRNYQVPGILWPFSTVINPAVNLGQLCPSENGSGVFSGDSGHCWPGGARLLMLPCSSACWHFENWLDMLVGSEGRTTTYWKPLIRFRGLVLRRLLSPFSLWGTERIKKRGGGGGGVWGRLPSHVEIALFAESFALSHGKQFIQRPALWGMGCTGLVGPSWLHFRGAFASSGLHQGSRAVPGYWAKLALGTLLPNLPAGLPLESSMMALGGPRPGLSPVGHAPLHFRYQEATGAGCKCHCWQRRSAQPCLHPCHGEIGGKGLALKIPLQG